MNQLTKTESKSRGELFISTLNVHQIHIRKKYRRYINKFSVEKTSKNPKNTFNTHIIMKQQQFAIRYFQREFNEY